MNRNYKLNSTVFITLEHKTYSFEDNATTLADPDDGYPEITIVDSDGDVIIDAAAMTKIATGKYKYLYPVVRVGEYTPPYGQWYGYIYVENGTYPDIQYFSFYVKG